jgi:sugar/nucleoside kinase (ribokinase family)
VLTERAFQQGSLCVVGNINRDIKAGPLTAGEYLFQDGEISVPCIAETIGGGGANSAFAAAALGAEVTFIGRLGADTLGDRLERTLKQHGIDSHLSRDKKKRSGTSIALAFDNGQRHFISSLPSCRALAFRDVDLAAMVTRRHLLRADVWFSDAMLRGGNLRLFKAARQAGMDVSLDLNWDPQWDRASRSQIKARKLAVRETLPWVNLVHGNVRELTVFADAANLKTALGRLVEWGADAVVVHLGENGAGYFDGKSLVIEPPVKVKRQINVTGTGDILCVCMILLHRPVAPDRERLRLANKIVAQFIEGKRTFIPTLAD